MHSLQYYPSRYAGSVGIGVEVIVHLKLSYFSATPDWHALSMSLQEIFEDIAPGVLVLNTMDHIDYITRFGRKACLMSMLVASLDERLSVELLRDYLEYLNKIKDPVRGTSVNFASGALHVVWH